MRKIFVFVCLLGFGAAAVAEDDYVLFETNFGDIVIDLYPEQAEITVENFTGYVEDGFYDELIFHRVIDRFMIQGGAYNADLTHHAPTSGPIVNESDNGLSNERGTIAMARTDDPDSATSQFFINHIDNLFLDYHYNDDPCNFGYAVFGKVVSGMEVVDAIAEVDTHYVNPGLRDVPDDPVIITSATVIPEPATILLLGLGCLAFVRRRGTGGI
ncbi:MAG: peptidylprolyl isomerase [Planctomycetota bacterium]|jgi:cyclophilin family peptidyl-prolyl cis-trans isomerase